MIPLDGESEVRTTTAPVDPVLEREGAAVRFGDLPAQNESDP